MSETTKPWRIDEPHEAGESIRAGKRCVLAERQLPIREPLSTQDLERKFLGNARFGGVDDNRAQRLLEGLPTLLAGPLDLGALRG